MADYKVVDRRGMSKDAPGFVVARGSNEVMKALAAGRNGTAPTNVDSVAEMHRSRMLNQKFAQTNSNGGSVQFATGRPKDPMFYWKDAGLPYEVNDENKLIDLREWCRLIYRSDPILGSCIDIYSEYPVLGVNLTCKDSQIVDFYNTLMFDELDYEDYLIDIGREYWTTGEAFPLGYFDEMLGVWESDELINPDDVFVHKSPFSREPTMEIKIPKNIRDILEKREPRHEYQQLIESYPELTKYTHTDAKMPVSNVLLKQLKFKGDTFNPRGVPLLMRCLRAHLQEEMLNAAQDSIASRLYTPLIHARIGASASDLGTERPWIPTSGDINSFLMDLDTALAADFRVLATHFAVELSSVFGRETMPNMDADFDRLTDKKLQAFGLSMAMLSGSDRGETYAGDALNRDLVSQLLTTYQRKLKRFMKDRMLVVAEAQGHYDSESRGGKRYVINEEVLKVDEDGTRYIEEQPKLLVPDVEMKSMSMKDEVATNQFMEALRASGIPISMRTRVQSTGIDLKEETDLAREEQVELAVQEQLTRREIYIALSKENLPIPADIKAAFAPKVAADPGAGPMVDPAVGTRPPQLGVDSQPTPALAPNGDDIANPAGSPMTPPTDNAGELSLSAGPSVSGGTPAVAALPRNKARPDESDEQRADMPKPASLIAPHHVGKRIVDPATVGLLVDERE